jgi:hypothetical protein
MEEWRPIPGFENYEVSNHGNVRRGNRIMKCYVITYPCGYKQVRVCLCKEGIKSYHIVARLIAKAFLPNPDNLPTVDHIDRNSLNNHVSNLRWETRHTQSMNRDYPLGASGLRHIYKRCNRWWVQIRRHGQNVFRKSFQTKEEAIQARDDFLATEQGGPL